MHELHHFNYLLFLEALNQKAFTRIGNVDTSSTMQVSVMTYITRHVKVNGLMQFQITKRNQFEPGYEEEIV